MAGKAEPGLRWRGADSKGMARTGEKKTERGMAGKEKQSTTLKSNDKPTNHRKRIT
jgi:hypothetical protein